MPRPIRILELRSVRGTGGGPEKTILNGAAMANPQQVAVTVCYLRGARDESFAPGRMASALRVDYVEVLEKYSLDPSVWASLRQIVRRRQIDIVHAHDYKTDVLALLLARVEGIVPLSTAHGWTGQSLRERFLYYPVDRLLLRSFPRVIAVSAEIRAVLLKAGAPPERILTVLNGIDANTWRRVPGDELESRRLIGLAPSEVAIGAVGRLTSQKRLDLLIEAAAKLRLSHPGVRLVVVGDGPLRAQWEAQALRQGVQCHFLGHRADVARLYPALDVLVQASDYEGTANVLLEAMALETPVVATDVGGTSEVMEHGVHGLLVPRRNADALAAALASTLVDLRATRRRVAAARLRVERELSFEGRMRIVEAIYRELVTGDRSRANAA